MRELARKPDLQYGLYHVGDEADVSKRDADGLQARLIVAALGDRAVRLTNGHVVGRVVEHAAMPFAAETRKSLGLPVTKGRKVPATVVVGVLWQDAAMLDMAKDATLDLGEDGFVLRGS